MSEDFLQHIINILGILVVVTFVGFTWSCILLLKICHALELRIGRDKEQV